MSHALKHVYELYDADKGIHMSCVTSIRACCREAWVGVFMCVLASLSLSLSLSLYLSGCVCVCVCVFAHVDI